MANVDGLKRSVENRAGFIAQRLRMDIATSLNLSAARRGHVKTSKMVNATKVTWTRISPTVWRVEASNPTIQAATTNSGARPHTIVARNARVLSWEKNGQRRFAKRVYHPGNRPSHWFTEIMSLGAIETLLRRFVGR